MIPLISALVLCSSLPAQQPRRVRAISEWLVAGTFPVDTGNSRVVRDYLGGETSALAVESKRWQRVSADSLGRVDLNRVFADLQREQAAAYAFVYITAPADRTVSLALETDDDGMAWLNGVLVYHKEVARGVGEADTVTLRLAKGVNRLMYKVVNRSGGFGFGGRLLPVSADRIDDLAVTAQQAAGPLASGPAPFVTLGRPQVSSSAALDSAGRFIVPVRIEVTRWGNVGEAVRLAFAGVSVPVPSAQGSIPTTVELRLPWQDLAAAEVSGRARVRATWKQGSTESADALRASDLLGLLSRPVTLDFQWQDRSEGRYRTRVPAVLSGLTLALDVAEYLPGSTIVLDGQPASSSDEREQIVLCSPCRAHAPISLRIATNGKQWWDAPRLIVRDVGWTDLVRSARYARTITGDASILEPPDSLARRLIALSAQPDKTAYHSAIDQIRAQQRHLEALLRRDTVDLIGNSHIDAAWLWRRPETIDVVRNTWRTAVKLLDKYPEMKFAASAAQYYVWLEQYEPDLLARIQELVRQGRWMLVGGMWVESDVNMPTGEALAMQELYGQRTFMRLFGKYATVAWIPDTFGYAWQLPQIFTQAGLSAFVTQKLRWNDTNRWTADRNYFIWQGRDGTGLPTYIPFGYDHDLDPDRLAREFRAQADSAATRRLMTLYGVGDHGGGPTMEMLDRRRETDRVPAFPVTRDADPAQSLAAMARAAQKPLTIDDELYFEYHRGVQTSQALTKQWNRRMEGLLLAAQAAAAIAPTAARASIETAWQMTLFNQFHDILPGSSIAGVYEDARADYRTADALAQGALTAALIALADSLDTRPPVQSAQPVFVFNPSGYVRSGIVTIVTGLANAKAYDARGQELPAASRGDSLQVFVSGVPSVGGTLVFVAAGKAAHAHVSKPATMLETDSLRLEIDPRTGNISHLYDKRLARELIKSGAQANALLWMPDTPRDWDAWNIDAVNGPWSAIADSVHIGSIEEDRLGVYLTVERSAPGVHVRQRYVLPRHSVRVDIENSIDWHPAHKLLKAFFPLALRADSVWAEIAYGAIGRPALPTTRKDSARFELPMHRWIDASAGDYGVSLVNDAKYGYDVKADTLRLSLLRAPKWPDPAADMGTHAFRYSIVPHRGTWASGATMAAADELNRPLRAVAVRPHAGVARTLSALRVEGRGIELSAVKRAEDSDNLVVRVVEMAGETGTGAIVLSKAAEWRETDLIERPRGTWQKSDGRIEITMRPWQVKTIEIRR